MTKDEMLKECFADNYAIIQRQIKEAMKNGERHIYVGIEGFDGFKPERLCTYETRDKLFEDGFEITDAGYDEWKISW